MELHWRHWNGEPTRKTAGLVCLHFAAGGTHWSLHLGLRPAHWLDWGRQWEPMVGHYEYAAGPFALLVQDAE